MKHKIKVEISNQYVLWFWLTGYLFTWGFAKPPDDSLISVLIYVALWPGILGKAIATIVN